MNIHVNEALGLFHLQSKDCSYIIQLVEGYPAHVYWGAQLHHDQSLASILELRSVAPSLPLPFLPAVQFLWTRFLRNTPSMEQATFVNQLTRLHLRTELGLRS
ncbi:hypothetical protein LWE69_00850 [Paenibacillus sp. UKAQ_18]|nr:hypothetical protein [Paenibacillus sp. UKAQ_18]